MHVYVMSQLIQYVFVYFANAATDCLTVFIVCIVCVEYSVCNELYVVYFTSVCLCVLLMLLSALFNWMYSPLRHAFGYYNKL